MRKINIQVLYDFADCRKKVDPWELAEAAESLYRSTKVVGINDTVVTYTNRNGKKVECKANETSMELRAFAAHIVRLVFRWDDMRSGRLESHFGLSLPMYEVLRDTGAVKTSGADLACTNVKELVETWATNK